MKYLPSLLVSFLIAGTLLFAGAVKVADPTAFYHDIVNFRILPELPSAWLAVYLPWFEILTAIALFVPALKHGAALSSALLFTVFAGAVGSAWARGLDIECGCFGNALKHGSLAVTLGIDLALLAGSLWLFSRVPGLRCER